MEKQDPISVVAKLIKFTIDADAPDDCLVIQRAAIGVGYWWRCTCSHISTADDARCANCDDPRPRELDQPKQILHIQWHGDVTLCGKPRSNETPVTEAKLSNCDVCICRAKSYGVIA